MESVLEMIKLHNEALEILKGLITGLERRITALEEANDRQRD